MASILVFLFNFAALAAGSEHPSTDTLSVSSSGVVQNPARKSVIRKIQSTRVAPTPGKSVIRKIPKRSSVAPMDDKIEKELATRFDEGADTITKYIYKAGHGGPVFSDTITGTIPVTSNRLYSVNVEVLRNDLGSTLEKVSSIKLKSGGAELSMGSCNPDGGDKDCTFYKCNLPHTTIATQTSHLDVEMVFRLHSHDCDCSVSNGAIAGCNAETHNWVGMSETRRRGYTGMEAVAKFELTDLGPADTLNRDFPSVAGVIEGFLPEELNILLTDEPGYGSWGNLLIGVTGAVHDMVVRKNGSPDSCPATAIQNFIDPQCIVDENKAKAFLDENGQRARLQPVGGMHVFDYRRLSKKWCNDNGIQFDAAGGPGSTCGTMVYGVTENLPRNELNGGLDSWADLTGLLWMHDNVATTWLGEHLLTFADSTTAPLTSEETAFFSNRGQGLLSAKGITNALPDFKVMINPSKPDNRWSYGDRCIATNGIVRIESKMHSNDFTFYFWDNKNSATGPKVYAEIDRHDPLKDTVWTFESLDDGSTSLGNKWQRGIYKPNTTTLAAGSYTVLKVLSGAGDETAYWSNFVAFMNEWCIKSLLTFKDDCWCKRQCAIKQINEVQGGCQSFTWKDTWFPTRTPSQADSKTAAEQCMAACSC